MATIMQWPRKDEPRFKASTTGIAAAGEELAAAQRAIAPLLQLINKRRLPWLSRKALRILSEARNLNVSLQAFRISAAGSVHKMPTPELEKLLGRMTRTLTRDPYFNAIHTGLSDVARGRKDSSTLKHIRIGTLGIG